MKQALTTVLDQGSEGEEHPLDHFIRLGPRSVLQVAFEQAVTEWLGRALIARWRARYPAAMACLEQDLKACLVYLKFPREHHNRIRTTTRLERTFGEGRRRTKVIPRCPTETACLTLVFATWLTAAQRWRGLRMTPRILRELDALRRERYPVQSQVA